MFGKLLKHELRHTARHHFFILGASLFATLAVGISLLTGATKVLDASIFPLVIISFAVVIVSLVSVIRSFNETMYSRQGYLTMTLPVKGSSILFSKVLVSFFWIIVSALAALLPFVFVYIHGRNQLEAMDPTVNSVISELSALLPELSVTLCIGIYFFLRVIITILAYVGLVYFSVTVANTRLLNKHPLFFGILVFLAADRITDILCSVVQAVLPLGLAYNESKIFLTLEQSYNLTGVMDVLPIIPSLMQMLISLALLIVTGYIISHKINLK